MHHDKTTFGEKQKTDIIQFYNKTKYGVDIMDKMLGQYSTHRKTNRWSVAFFYNILDIAALSSYIIYTANNDILKKKSNARSLFLFQLGEELCLPMIQHRSQNVHIMKNFSAKTAIESILGEPVINIPDKTAVASTSVARDNTGRKKVLGSCYICNNKSIRKRRKTRKHVSSAKNQSVTNIV